MTESHHTGPRRAWLASGAACLTAIYAVLWRIDLYLYIIGIAAGTLAFFSSVAVLAIARVARRRRPILERADVLAAAGGCVTHVIAWGVLRTVNWC